MSLTNLGDGAPEAVWFGYIEVARVKVAGAQLERSAERNRNLRQMNKSRTRVGAQREVVRCGFSWM